MLALNCGEQSVLQCSLGWFVSAITWRSGQDKAVCLWESWAIRDDQVRHAGCCYLCSCCSACWTHLGRRHCQRTWWAFSQWELALRRWRICDSGPFLVSERPNLSLLRSCNCTLDHVLLPAWSQGVAHLGHLKNISTGKVFKKSTWLEAELPRWTIDFNYINLVFLAL